MLKTLDVMPAIKHVIPHSDPSPAITFQRAVLDLIEKSKAKTDKEHTLMIIHYAGHGMIKNGTFTFAETKAGSRMINADNALIATVKDSTIILEYIRLPCLLHALMIPQPPAMRLFSSLVNDTHNPGNRLTNSQRCFGPAIRNGTAVAHIGATPTR